MIETDQDFFDQAIEVCDSTVAFEGVSDRPRPYLVAQLMAHASGLLRNAGMPSDVATERVGELVFARADELRRAVNDLVKQAMVEALAEAKATLSASETKH